MRRSVSQPTLGEFRDFEADSSERTPPQTPPRHVPMSPNLVLVKSPSRQLVAHAPQGSSSPALRQATRLRPNKCTFYKCCWLLLWLFVLTEALLSAVGMMMWETIGQIGFLEAVPDSLRNPPLRHIDEITDAEWRTALLSPIHSVTRHSSDHGLSDLYMVHYTSGMRAVAKFMQNDNYFHFDATLLRVLPFQGPTYNFSKLLKIGGSASDSSIQDMTLGLRFSHNSMPQLSPVASLRQPLERVGKNQYQAHTELASHYLDRALGLQRAIPHVGRNVPAHIIIDMQYGKTVAALRFALAKLMPSFDVPLCIMPELRGLQPLTFTETDFNALRPTRPMIATLPPALQAGTKANQLLVTAAPAGGAQKGDGTVAIADGDDSPNTDRLAYLSDGLIFSFLVDDHDHNLENKVNWKAAPQVRAQGSDQQRHILFDLGSSFGAGPFASDISVLCQEPYMAWRVPPLGPPRVFERRRVRHCARICTITPQLALLLSKFKVVRHGTFGTPVHTSSIETDNDSIDRAVEVIEAKEAADEEALGASEVAVNTLRKLGAAAAHMLGVHGTQHAPNITLGRAWRASMAKDPLYPLMRFGVYRPVDHDGFGAGDDSSTHFFRLDERSFEWGVDHRFARLIGHLHHCVQRHGIANVLLNGTVHMNMSI